MAARLHMAVSVCRVLCRIYCPILAAHKHAVCGYRPKGRDADFVSFIPDCINADSIMPGTVGE
ncbi:MAG: hypothetical protein ABH885_08260 [Candidatus Omnitrophota bacterium]